MQTCTPHARRPPGLGSKTRRLTGPAAGPATAAYRCPVRRRRSRGAPRQAAPGCCPRRQCTRAAAAAGAAEGGGGTPGQHQQLSQRARHPRQSCRCEHSRGAHLPPGQPQKRIVWLHCSCRCSRS
eukprot:57909-Chlamydomonas_euryale.AAC.1